MNLIIINLGVWGYSPTSKMEKNKRYNRSILIPFLVSAYALTVLAIKVISVKRLFSSINYTALIEANKQHRIDFKEYFNINNIF
ncbi:TPA: hypothetical protein ACIKUN_000499 [Streptococcus agalactiae]